MLHVRFFARLREELGCGELRDQPLPVPATVAALRQQLAAQGSLWQQALLDPLLICAVNHVTVGDEHPLIAGDEVAFFPPVTGG